jgi:rod shape-determining protein MreC
MALYTPGRRRAILILLLSSLLILTIDLRGNAIFDAMRSGYNQAMRPFESASEVVSRPIRNAWRGITKYDDLEAENQRLRERIEEQQANDIANQATYSQYLELLAYFELEGPGSYGRVTASVVGESPSNLDQVIEINRGENDGLRTGMAVIATNGVVGRVTSVEPDRARVRLITDTQYAVQVKVVRPPETTTTTVATTVPTTVPGATAPVSTSTSTTTAPTTTIPGQTTTTVPPTTLPDPQRETGQLVGRGPDREPEVVFIDDTPGFGTPEVGDIVSTSGGSVSFAPADLPIGVVVEVRQGSPSEGLIVVVQPYAELDDLEFVQVILYRPDSESAQPD